jgi:hypothetical protein
VQYALSKVLFDEYFEGRLPLARNHVVGVSQQEWLECLEAYHGLALFG